MLDNKHVRFYLEAYLQYATGTSCVVYVGRQFDIGSSCVYLGAEVQKHWVDCPCCGSFQGCCVKTSMVFSTGTKGGFICRLLYVCSVTKIK